MRFSCLILHIQQKFDYIIAGAGAAGYSLLMRLLQDPELRHKSILVVDASAKDSNDRTWCFWENKLGFFESIVHHQWAALDFHTDQQSIALQMGDYRYKMIRGLDFYQHCQQTMQAHSNVQWLQANLIKIEQQANGASIATTKGEYSAQYIFNSILLSEPKVLPHQFHLLQHFKGWFIETEQPVFDPGRAGFMDFRVPQNLGTTFLYVLPTTPHRALVEYTFFNEKLLTQAGYDQLLRSYIHSFVTKGNFTIVETEYGVIPMTNASFGAGQQNVVHLGTAAGQTKASTGFTFQNIQRHSDAIVLALKQGNSPIIAQGWWQKRFRLYDSTLLHVLHHQLMGGREVFGDIFNNVNHAAVFRFLDSQSSFWDELKVMNAVPTRKFLPAALKECWKSIRY
jgi:lycopene beta-cyclase